MKINLSRDSYFKILKRFLITIINDLVIMNDFVCIKKLKTAIEKISSREEKSR